MKKGEKSSREEFAKLLENQKMLFRVFLQEERAGPCKKIQEMIKDRRKCIGQILWPDPYPTYKLVITYDIKMIYFGEKTSERYKA